MNELSSVCHNVLSELAATARPSNHMTFSMGAVAAVAGVPLAVAKAVVAELVSRCLLIPETGFGGRPVWSVAPHALSGKVKP